MLERIREIPKRILEWWKKFTKRQKFLILGITGTVIIALAILIFVLTRPKMITLVTCNSVKESKQVVDLLAGENIGYELAENDLVVRINEKDKSAAIMLLGSNGIPADEYNLENVFNGGFSTTEADKTKRYKLYLEEKISNHLKTLDKVENASVTLTIPENDGTIISQNKETYASVLLTTKDKIDEDTAGSIARYVATAVGDDTTNNVTIIDGTGNVIFAGGDTATITGTAASQLSIRNKAEAQVKKQVKDILLGTKLYNNVEVGLNLRVDFSSKEVTDHRYYVDDGRSEGYILEERRYSKEAEGGNRGIPGTDSNNNDNTTYVFPDTGYSSEVINETDIKRAPSETITKTNTPAGVIVPDQSSISVVASKYTIYREEDLEKAGTLNGTTFEAYAAANSTPTKMEVDQDLITQVANATGIAAERISVTAYNTPLFQPKASTGPSISEILQYVLMGLVILLLGFVVIRSTRKEEVIETEPELSVESLLQSTKEELEDIGLQEKSETRVMIEKFVDENPEAVANLLRNWLTEDWE